MKVYCTLLVLFLLSGCVAGAFVVGAATSVVVMSDRRTLPTITQDENITYQAHQLLLKNKLLSHKTHIVVTSFNQVVLLAGQAPTTKLRAQAEQVVQAIPKIRRLYNQITVTKPTSHLVRSQDALITANLKARFLAAANLRPQQIKIITENATVFLMGLTTHEQAHIAVDLARHGKGVKQVVKIIEYMKN